MTLHEAGKAVSSTVEAMRSQPGLLFLTIVNMAFLIFVYFVGNAVLAVYREDQAKIHERYMLALHTLDRCVEVGLNEFEKRTAPETDPDYGGPR